MTAFSWKKITLRHERGFLLPLTVLMLITVGSGAVVTLSTSTEIIARHAEAPRYLIAQQQFQHLYQAKQALIAYAVSYADNYGPGGAGPGHFPCPDLDAPDDGNPYNDGPDPPCGAGDQQIGRVPRITLASRPADPEVVTNSEFETVQGENRHKLLEFYPEISFTDRQPWYWIDGGFINNPLNRIVNGNTGTSLRTRQGRDVIAVLLTPGQETLAQQRPGFQAADYVESVVSARIDGVLSRDHLTNSNDNVLFIYRDEVMPWVKRRVAGFVAENLRENRLRNCSFLENVSTNCYPFAAVAVPGSDTCQPTQTTSERLHYEQCSDWMLSEDELQGVSQRRHWFYRNRWDQFIDFSVASICLEQLDFDCVITIETDDRDTQSAKMMIIVQPPSDSQPSIQAGSELHG